MSLIDLASPATVEALYAGHHSWLRSWLHRRLGDSFSAADVAHDTFVRVLSKDVPPAIREPRALLTTIAQGLVLNLRRHQRIEQAYLDVLALMPEQYAPSPETQAILIQTLVEIDRLLDGLGPKVRQVFLLSQLDGLRQAEIASRLGLSVPTVKRYIAKALVQCSFA